VALSGARQDAIVDPGALQEVFFQRAHTAIIST